MPRLAYSVLFALLLAGAVLFRLASIQNIHPGNAPDEGGHLYMAVALSHGTLPTYQESRAYTWYPYPLFNPLGYAPAAAGLALGGVFRPELQALEKPVRDFSFATTYVARYAQLAWFLGFLLVFAALARRWPEPCRSFAAMLVLYLPQLTFVQTYVNADAMGLFAGLYLIWAIACQKRIHLGLAVFLLASAKANYYPFLALPLFWLPDVRREPRVFARQFFSTYVIPLAFAGIWFLRNYWVNTRHLGGNFLGFSTMTAVIDLGRGGWRILDWDFIHLSLQSAVGVFGWLNQYMNGFYRDVWVYELILPGFAYLLYRCARPRSSHERRWAAGLAAIACLNVLAHYYASFSSTYQPQGRYLLPAVLISLAATALLLHDLIRRFRLPTRVFVGVLLLFVVLSGRNGIRTSHGNPYALGFGYPEGVRPPLSQSVKPADSVRK